MLSRYFQLFDFWTWSSGASKKVPKRQSTGTLCSRWMWLLCISHTSNPTPSYQCSIHLLFQPCLSQDRHARRSILEGPSSPETLDVRVRRLFDLQTSYDPQSPISDIIAVMLWAISSSTAKYKASPASANHGYTVVCGPTSSDDDLFSNYSKCL